jgi:RimJ/RimL family protein N-acetyltransferase
VTVPVLTTDRFELWRPQVRDLPELYALTADDETRRFLGSFVPSEMDSFNRLHRNAGSWALHGYGTFMVRPKGAAEIVGNCGVFRSHRGFGPEHRIDDVPEAGWIIRRDWWGKGVASEVMKAALAWFDGAHGHQRVACMIEEGHATSDKIAARLGFVRYGEHRGESGPAVVLYERSLTS